MMIVITGAAGFIGSCLLAKFNSEGISDIVIADDFSHPEKEKNYSEKKFSMKVDRDVFPSWLAENAGSVSYVLHIGARTDTTEFNREIFDRLNLEYSKSLWTICASRRIPFIYASSAATYGLGEHGYSDDHAVIPSLKPLNPYGDSKQEFDKWVLQQDQSPPNWYGLKFFNVYGPNEYHKGRMASVIFHAFHQVQQKGRVKLFRSHNPSYPDGGQLRDFVYVKDLTSVIWYLFTHGPANGIYNLGSGTARTFLDLASAVFSSMDRSPEIDFIDTPSDIRDKYQYFTEADMSKLVKTGYSQKFTSLEEGVNDYVRNYLAASAYM